MRPVAAAAVLAALLSVTACNSSSAHTGPLSSPAGSSTTSTSSSPAPTTSAAPLSAFENDPAVKALRAWLAEAGRTINSGHYTSAALRALMTPDLAKTMKHVLGSDVGSRYPGPLPGTPVSVRVVSSVERDVHLCAVLDGYSVNPRTHKPFKPHRVGPIDAGAVLTNGRWLVAKLDTATFSCRGVTIPELPW